MKVAVRGNTLRSISMVLSDVTDHVTVMTLPVLSTTDVDQSASELSLRDVHNSNRLSVGSTPSRTFNSTIFSISGSGREAAGRRWTVSCTTWSPRPLSITQMRGTGGGGQFDPLAVRNIWPPVMAFNVQLPQSAQRAAETFNWSDNDLCVTLSLSIPAENITIFTIAEIRLSSVNQSVLCLTYRPSLGNKQLLQGPQRWGTVKR